MRFVIALALLVLSPTLASAHTGMGSTVGFAHGLLHPLGGLDHVLAMLAVGVLAAVLGGRALWLVPLSFLALMVAGFGLGLAHIDLPFAELGIALSSVVIGLAATLRRPLSVPAAMALVGAFALFHGHAHGAEMPATASGMAYAAGFLAATALLCLLGAGVTRTIRALSGRHGATIARAVAGACALCGIGLLAGWL